jgi:hypothetical protein
LEVIPLLRGSRRRRGRRRRGRRGVAYEQTKVHINRLYKRV